VVKENPEGKTHHPVRCALACSWHPLYTFADEISATKPWGITAVTFYEPCFLQYVLWHPQSHGSAPMAGRVVIRPLA
jgi:hypothetical protein